MESGPLVNHPNWNAQVTLDTTGRMLLGTDIAAALTTLESLPVVDVRGPN